MRLRSLPVWVAALLAATLLARCGGDSSQPAPDASLPGGGDFESWGGLDAHTAAPGEDAGTAAGRDAAPAAGPDASSTAQCCVVFTIGDGGTQSYCQGPALTGSGAATPTIGSVSTAYGTNVELHSGLAQTSQKSALYVTLYARNSDAGVVQAGTFDNPQIDFYDPGGGWWENNASNGSLTIEAWSAVGTQVTGSFNGQIADMSGSGGFPGISGTFCAVRAADK